MNKNARMDQGSGDRAYFKFTILVGRNLRLGAVSLFPIYAALKHAIGPHENGALNVTFVRSCFLNLEHSPFTLFAVGLSASSSPA